MKIGETIRKYRKEKNMTQEEMAKRLGVTPPAVNKWENGNSMPDILLLAPIARLLDITLDTLLSFQAELTDEEINALVKKVQDRLKTEDFLQVFSEAKKQMETYPGSERLHLYMALILQANCMAKGYEDVENCGEFLQNIFVRLLKSKDEYIRTTAADALYNACLRKEKYEEAEAYLEYFSRQSTERKRKKALLCERMGRTEEAYRIYEQLLFSGYQTLNMVLASMFSMAKKAEDSQKAELLANKAKDLADVFDMGEYQKASAELELLTWQQDVEGTLKCIHRLINGVKTMDSYTGSFLYEHLTFKKLDPEFKQNIQNILYRFLTEEKDFGYMEGNEEWEKILAEIK